MLVGLAQLAKPIYLPPNHKLTNNVCLCVYLIQFFLGVQELRDSTDELWVHEQRLTVAAQRQRDRVNWVTLNILHTDRPTDGPTDWRTLTERWGRPTFLWSTSRRGFDPEGFCQRGWWRRSHPAPGPGRRSKTGSVTWETQRHSRRVH